MITDQTLWRQDAFVNGAWTRGARFGLGPVGLMVKVPEARTLIVTPYDKSALKEIEKAIVAHPNLGSDRAFTAQRFVTRSGPSRWVNSLNVSTCGP